MYTIHTHTLTHTTHALTHTSLQSDMFQDDIYPPTFAGKAAQTAEEWISGQNKDPLLIAFAADGLTELSVADSQVVSSSYGVYRLCMSQFLSSKYWLKMKYCIVKIFVG